MNLIDLFDFSTYFKSFNDRNNAKIGHVNEVISKVTDLEDAVANIPAPTTTVVDGVTITGSGTFLDPLVAVPVTPTPAYKVWSGLVTQIGTNAPTINKVFQNTLTNPLTFTYGAVGRYGINCSDILGSDNASTNTFVLHSGIAQGSVNVANFFGGSGTIRSYNNSAVAVDNYLLGVYIELRIY
jgi:hypothetical protein